MSQMTISVTKHLYVQYVDIDSDTPSTNIKYMKNLSLTFCDAGWWSCP